MTSKVPYSQATDFMRAVDDVPARLNTGLGDVKGGVSIPAGTVCSRLGDDYEWAGVRYVRLVWLAKRAGPNRRRFSSPASFWVADPGPATKHG